MITIIIIKTSTVEYTERVNFIKKETPTAITQDSDYGNKKTNLVEKEYEAADVKKYKEVETVLLKQNLDETDLDLKAVIKAINKLP
jgi:hypothetical protein